MHDTTQSCTVVIMQWLEKWPIWGHIIFRRLKAFCYAEFKFPISTLAEPSVTKHKKVDYHFVSFGCKVDKKNSLLAHMYILQAINVMAADVPVTLSGHQRHKINSRGSTAAPGVDIATIGRASAAIILTRPYGHDISSHDNNMVTLTGNQQLWFWPDHVAKASQILILTW